MIRILGEPGVEGIAKEITEDLHSALRVVQMPEVLPAGAVWGGTPEWDDVLIVLYNGSDISQAAKAYIGAFRNGHPVTDPETNRLRPGGFVIPVALDPKAAKPPEPISGIKALVYDETARGKTGSLADWVGVFLGLALGPGDQRIFISYRSVDGSEIAKDLCNRLEHAGFQPWLDEAKEEFDLRLMSSLNDENGIPTSGTNLVIVADVSDVLHFRIFDAYGKIVADTNQTLLTSRAGPIEDLKKQLDSLRPPHELTPSEKGQVVKAVTSIVGHASKVNLPPGSDVQDVITENLKRASMVLVVDTPEAPKSRWIKVEIDAANCEIIPVLPVVVGKRDRSRFVPLAYAQRHVLVKSGGVDRQPLSNQEWDLVLDKVSELLRLTYQRRRQTTFNTEQIFRKKGFDWDEKDGTKLIYRSWRKRQGINPRVAVLSHCCIHDATDISALRAYRDYLEDYDDIAGINWKLCVYDQDETLSEAEQEAIDDVFPDAPFILAHHSELPILLPLLGIA